MSYLRGTTLHGEVFRVHADRGRIAMMNLNGLRFDLTLGHLPGGSCDLRMLSMYQAQKGGAEK